VTIANGVTSIGSCAFCANQLASITIPESVTSIGSDPFGGNTTLTNITVNGSNPNYMSSNNALYTKDGKTLIVGTKDSANNILSTTTTIGNNAFSYKDLTSVTIPSSVTSIGEAAFNNNPTLTTITVNSSNTKYMSSNNAIYTKDGKTLVFGTKTSSTSILSTTTAIGNNAFYGMGLTSATIPNKVTSIGNYAFYNNKITQGNFKIDNKSGNVSIGSYALQNNGPSSNITITPTYLR
jgi:hypothetical protein